MCLKLQPQNVVVQFALKKFGEGIVKNLGFEFRNWRIMQTKTLNYLAKNIAWKRTTDPHYPFAANVEGEKCAIRLNDFPDEHLYTLIANGKEIVSFDDWSAKWTRPAKKKSVSQAAPNKPLDVRAKQRLS